MSGAPGLAHPLARRRRAASGRAARAIRSCHRGEVAPHVLELGAAGPCGRRTPRPARSSARASSWSAGSGASGWRTSSSCLAAAPRLGHLAAPAARALRGGAGLMIRHPQLGLEGQRRLAEPLQLAPSAGAPRPPAPRRLAACGAAASSAPGRGHPLVGPASAASSSARSPSPARRRRPGPEARSAFLEPVLGRPDPLVPQHPGEELRPLGRAHRRHHRQLLLAGEIGVEELVARHAQQAGDPLGDGADAVGDRGGIAVLVQLGAGSASGRCGTGARPRVNSISTSTRARGGAPRRRMVSRLPRARRHAVHGPGDGLEQGGLPGAVRADDAGQARRRARARCSRAGGNCSRRSRWICISRPPGPARPRPSAPRPSRTNASRSSSAGSGRRSR